MSRLVDRGRRLLAVLFAMLVTGLAAALPAHAAPVVTELGYECKLPLVLPQPVSVKLSLELPANGGGYTPQTPPIDVRADVSFDGLSGVRGFAGIEGSAQASFVATGPDGVPRPTDASLEFLQRTTTKDLVGTERIFGFAAPPAGETKLVLTSFAMNLRAINTAGAPILLDPVSRNWEGGFHTDSDADPTTFDLVCRLVSPAGVDPRAIPVGSWDTTPECPADAECNEDLPPTRPTAVVGLPGDIGTSSLRLRWGASQPGGCGLKGYIIEFDGQEVEVPAGTTEKLITDLGGDTEYWFQIFAVDNCGNRSEPLNVTMITHHVDPFPPGPPTDLVATPSNGSVTLSWKAPKTGDAPAGYRVFNGAVQVANVTGTTATINGLQPNVDYTFRVAAYTAQGLEGVPATVSLKWTEPESPLPTYDFTVKGSASVKTIAKGSVPLTGLLKAQFSVGTGALSADLSLNPTTARLVAAGFLPVTARLGFAFSGKTTGLLYDETLTTRSKVRIKVQEVKLFGAIPLAGGNNCQTKELTDLTLKSTDAGFLPQRGGTLAGTFKMSNLNGCGVLNGLVSPLTAGDGNTISIGLAPVRY